GRLEQTNRTQSLTFGFDSEIQDGWFAGWQVNGYYQKGKNKNSIDMIDFIRTDRIAAALDAVVDPSNGSIVCRATLFNNPYYQDCVPINLFGAGNASQEAIDYVLGPDKQIRGVIEQEFAEFSMNGEIWEG